jgi:hypothetical protein
MEQKPFPLAGEELDEGRGYGVRGLATAFSISSFPNQISILIWIGEINDPIKVSQSDLYGQDKFFICHGWIKKN